MTNEGNMNTVSLAQAKAKLSEILNQVESGVDVVVTRHGRPIACISAIRAPKKPIKSLAAFRSKMPRWRKSSASLLREMRDEGL
jgi:prevent-host-death family protein